MTEILELKYVIDTFYFLVCGALVMWMAAGFTMLEAGLVRTKNVTDILVKNVALYSTACIMYMLVGYNIMYGTGVDGFLIPWSGVIPGIDFLLGSVDHTAAVVTGADGAPYYSKMADFFFQVVFVATAMSIVSGAVAERMKLWSFLTFAVVLTGFIYPIQGYWKWGGGFLDQMGFQDFAGSGVVHLTGAAAALAGVLLLGARKGKYGKDGSIHAIPGSNLPMAALGTMILWLGWFGFNGGSQLIISTLSDANAVANIFVNTNMAAAGGLLTALFLSKWMFGKSDLTLALNGALAGLVAITAEPLAPSAASAVLIGGIGGILVILSIITLDRLKIDDPVGAISVHGIVGIWGLMAVPLTNTEASFVTQAIGTGVIFGWVFITSLIVWLVLKYTIGIRVGIKEEHQGSDIEECGLEAYPEFTDR